MSDRTLLPLSIITLVFGSLICVALFLSRTNPHIEAHAPILPYVLMSIVMAFMFLFGYIPLSMYLEQRKGMKVR